MGYLFRQNPAISKCSLKIFYGGHWKDKVYTSGNIIWVDDFDPNKANLAELQKIAAELGYQDTQTSCSYTSPSTKNVVNINSEEDVKKMVEEIPVSRDLDIYFDGVRKKEEPEEHPTILFWNCSGLGDPTIDMLKVIINIYGPSIIFLIETRLSSKVIKNVSSSLGFQNVWDCAVTKAAVGEDNCVGLAMLMKPNVNVTFLDKTSNYLDFVITVDSTGKKWRLTGFYGHPKLKNRSWEWLRKLSEVQKNLPWIIFGDFNEILYLTEKKGGWKRKEDDSKMEAFQTIRKKCGLHNMPFEGSKYTWKRGNIKQRLDRGLMTMNWKKMFPSHRVLHLTNGDMSDHMPIVIQTNGEKHKDGNAGALRDVMKSVFQFAEQLEEQYQSSILGLTTVSNIVNEIKPKRPNNFYFEMLKMIAPQVIHGEGIALHDTDAATVKYERLVTLKTRYDLSFILWNCMVLPKLSGDDLETRPECPSASCKEIITKDVNLSKFLAKMWNLVSMILKHGGKITKQKIIDGAINKQVEKSITWLKDFIPQKDDKKFVIGMTTQAYDDMIDNLQENATMVCRAVLLYNIIVSLVRREKVARAGIIAELKEKLSENLTYYFPPMFENDKPHTLYVTESLQYLLNNLKWRDGISGYKIDTEAKELSGLEDRRFKAERLALMSEDMLPLIEKIRGSGGSIEIKELKKLIRDTYITDKMRIQKQIELLLYMNIVRSDGNVIELVETGKSRESIVDRLGKASDIALKSLKNTTSKKAMKYMTYIDKITKIYKKSKDLKGA